MTEAIIRFADLLLLSLLVGAIFGIWLGSNPNELSAGAYIEQQQHGIRGLNTPMPILGAVCILLTIVLAVMDKDNRTASYLLIASAACGMVAGAVTRFLNQPINTQVMTWSSQASPSNWTELRDQWWRWHVVRTFAGIAALSLLTRLRGFAIRKKVLAGSSSWNSMGWVIGKDRIQL